MTSAPASPPDISITTTSVDQTRALGAALAPLLAVGDLVVLSGDLGAGKTALTQGLCAALGIHDGVTSPTFTLANRYEGSARVHHLDVYRLGGPDEAEDLAIDELLEDGITLIEWGEIIDAALPSQRMSIVLGLGEGDDDRCIDLYLEGDIWNQRRNTIVGAVQEVSAR